MKHAILTRKFAVAASLGIAVWAGSETASLAGVHHPVIGACVAGCKVALKAGLDACCTTAQSCLKDTCGIDGLPPSCGRPGHGA